MAPFCRHLSSEYPVDTTLNSSRYDLSKRQNGPYRLVNPGAPRIAWTGVTMVVRRLGATMQGFYLPLSPVTLAELGADYFAYRLQNLANQPPNVVRYIHASSQLSATGRVFATYAAFSLGIGTDSWAAAFQYMDPQGLSQNAGQQTLTTYMQQIFQYMVDQNLSFLVVSFTRHIVGQQNGVPIAADVIIMNMCIGIVYR